MQLVGSYTSPFVRKIRILLVEKGLPFSFLEDIPWNEDTRAPNYNPLGKVPILIDEHGAIWHDSKVIAQYIEALHTLKPMIPPDLMKAVKVRQTEALADGIAEAGIAIFLEKKREVNQQNPGWITRQQSKITHGLDHLDKQLGENIWMHSDNFSLADIAVGAMLGWFDLRMPWLNWRDGHPNLREYAERLFARESFIETKPPPVP